MVRLGEDVPWDFFNRAWTIAYMQNRYNLYDLCPTIYVL